MKPIYFLSLGIASALTAIVVISMLFRWDTTLQPNGSSVSRDRLTGDIRICSAANVCQIRPSTNFVDPDLTSFRELLDQVGKDIDAKRQAEAVQSRSTKSLVRKSADLFLSLCAGVTLPFIDAFDWLLGPPTYVEGQAWTTIWETRNAVSLSFEALRREHVLNSLASGVGYMLTFLIGALLIVLAGQKLRRRFTEAPAAPSVHQ